MCEPVSWTTVGLLAASAAATAAGTYASHEASQQQDRANASAISDRSRSEERSMREAMANQQQALAAQRSAEEERRAAKSGLADQQLAEQGADVTEEKVAAEASRLKDLLAPVQMVNSPAASPIGGDQTGVRVVQDAIANERQKSLNQIQNPMSQALAQMMARGNVGLGNQIAQGGLRDQFLTADNIYSGNMAAANMRSGLGSQLYGLGMQNALNSFNYAQPGIAQAGQGWRTGASIAQGVGGLAGTAAGYDWSGSGNAGAVTGYQGKTYVPKTSSTGGTYYALK